MAEQVSAGQADTARIIAAVRAGVSTRRELSTVLGLGRAPVTQRLEALLAAGLLVEGEFAASTGGRAAREYRFNDSGGVALAARIGIESYRVAVTDLSGAVISAADGEFLLGAEPAAVLSAVERDLRTLFSAIAAPAPVWGVGVGIAGTIEFTTGRPIAPLSLPGWHGYNVRQQLSRAFNAPCWVDNDANLMALGELRAGAGRSVENLVFIYTAGGVGAGIVSHGQVHRGETGGAGDIGHIHVSDDPDRVCVCGSTGCLSAVIGSLAIEQAALRARQPAVGRDPSTDQTWTYRDVIQNAASGDQVAVAIVDEAAVALGGTIAMLVNVLNPAVVVLGGSLVEGDGRVLSRVREIVYRRSTRLAAEHLSIELSSLGPDAGIMGAAQLVVEQALRSPTFLKWYRQDGRSAHPGPLADLAESVDQLG
ncbi:ROK family protein [Actinoplanes sp. NPDC049265]|uniref:ROK family protein n=1 Tax=Actinoplanes sp. NPDC049265 TaxID=3363902 RepID=UPI00372079D0